MAQKLWNGATAAFTTAADWTGGVPVAGDTAIITAGRVTATGSLPSNLEIQLTASAGSSPSLVLSAATLGFGSRIRVAANAANSTLLIGGATLNAGAIDLTGAGQGVATMQLQDAAGGAATRFTNTGAINITNTAAVFGQAGTNAGNTLVNDGVISIRNASGNKQESFGLAIAGTGTIRLGAANTMVAQNSVGAGQTLLFEAGTASASTLQINSPLSFNATIAGFAASDLIGMFSPVWDTAAYVSTGAHSGALQLSSGSNLVASLAFSGDYTLSAFNLSTQISGSLERTLITTSVAEQPARFAFTDPTLDLNGQEAGTAYDGPVAGLQWQYLWSGTDPVAIAASVPNVFLKGGAGGDALAVTGGTNVLDGGGGSNFLVGGTGQGSFDTFFVDGRGGVETWSTIVNFHAGDQAAIFGFHAGTSTLPWTASDGAAGYTGVTIHSELNGVGTGVNGSFTFAGLTQADVDAHFSITTGTLLPGTADAVDYLLIQHNR